jgi:hypothetical protein
VHMPSRMLSRSLLFIIFAIWTTAGVSGIAFGLSGTGAAGIGSAPGYGPKIQFAYGGALAMSVPLLDWLWMDISFEFSGALPSDTSGGFLYRGYDGFGLGVMVQGAAIVATAAHWGTLGAGGGVGIGANLPAYQNTTLYFLLPELRVDGLLNWRPYGLSQLALQLTLPVHIQLRKDMTYSATAGLGLGLSYSLGAAK